MNLPKFPSFCFQIPIKVIAYNPDLNMDGYHDKLYELEDKCNFRAELGKIQNSDLEIKDYTCVAVISGNPFEKLPKVGKITIHEEEYDIVRVVPHADFDGTIHYVSIYCK